MAFHHVDHPEISVTPFTEPPNITAHYLAGHGKKLPPAAAGSADR
jgi:hypothetical protein